MSRSFPPHPRRDPRPISFHSGRLRGHARTRSPPDQRTRRQHAFGRDARPQSALRARTPAPASRANDALARQPVERRARGRTRVAATFLRLRGVEPTKARGEAAPHASQSGEASLGDNARGMEVEQFPALCLRRSRTGSGERATSSETEAGPRGCPQTNRGCSTLARSMRKGGIPHGQFWRTSNHRSS